MSYQVIARKWRPQTFEEVTGQESITHTLRNAVEHERLHHAYLFSGARGVGKTTTARLLAKAVNCHSSPKPVAKSCNECASCKEIAEGRSMDVLEIDAASHTGIDSVRETIIDNINISPARDRYKIFIIDEVHQLSKHAFNALLKTLEEPPSNVLFIMATTEKDKVLDTILSRCQEFEFRTIATAKIYERLNLIAEAEKVTVTAEALREIARSGEGSMRDAQSNFDQVISFSGETIDIDDVVKALGIASSEILTRTIEAIAHRKPHEALLVVEDLMRRGQDLRNFCRDLLAFLRDLLVAKVSHNVEGLLDSAILDQAALRKYAEHFSESDIVRLFNSLADTETQLLKASQPRYLLEIGLVKLMEMQRVTAIEKILERLAKLELGAPIEEKKTLNSSEQLLVDGGQSSELKVQISESKSENKIENRKSKIENRADFSLDDVPFPIKNEETKVEIEEIETEIPELKIEVSEPKPVIEVPKPLAIEQSQIPNPKSQIEIKPNFYDNLPMRLPDISSEDLEHFEDSKLDSAYEHRLVREGDNLKAIKTASKIIANVLHINLPTPVISTNGTAVAPAQAKPKINFQMPEFATESESGEAPILPENPTEEEMWQFAESHPTVKRALRIFRGKIVNVTKES